MNILGIDYGRKRVGLSRSNPLGVAVGSGVLTEENQDKLFKKLEEIVKEHEISKIIVGLPKNMNNTVGEMAKEVLKFVDILKQKTGVSVETWDERLTTSQADRAMRQAGFNQGKRQGKRDEIAAILLLQSYLDSTHISQQV